MIDRKTRNEGIWLLAALALFWGANWPAMKLAVGEVGPWTFRTICLYVGAGGLFGVALARGIPMSLPRGQVAVFAGTSVLNVTVWHVTSAYGLTLLGAGRAVLVAFTMPLWAALFAWLFFGETFTRRKLFALGLGLAGLALLALPASDTLGHSLAGLALMLAAAVGWALGTVWLKSRHFAMSAVTLTAWQLAIGGVPVILGMLVFEVAGIGGGVVLKHDSPSFAGWIGLVYAATVPMIFCHWAWFRALEILPASLAAIGTLAVPVVGVLASALLLGEAVGWSEAAALLCVVAALALALLQI